LLSCLKGREGKETVRPVTEPLSVAQLLERCSRRPPDEVAWQEFVRRYHPIIKSNVIKTFRRKVREESDRKAQFTEDLVEDLVQSVYARLIEEHNRAIIRFEGLHENSIYQYLAMISVNVVLDYFREARAQKRPKISFSLDELLENSGDGPLLSEAVSRIDGQPAGVADEITLGEIERALKRSVSGKHRDRDTLIFKLRYYEGLTLEEIRRSLNLDISPISIGSILNRIIMKMRPLLNPPDRSKNGRR
jgi:RNA polymerase sigma factor (sigma-70 family)